MRKEGLGIVVGVPSQVPRALPYRKEGMIEGGELRLLGIEIDGELEALEDSTMKDQQWFRHVPRRRRSQNDDCVFALPNCCGERHVADDELLV